MSLLPSAFRFNPQFMNDLMIRFFSSWFLKACVCYFLSNFYFWPNDSPFLAYLCISIFPSFSPVSHCFIGWSKIILKVYDVNNCQNKNLITHFVWYLKKEKRYEIETSIIDIVLNKEHFYGKVMQKMCTKS